MLRDIVKNYCFKNQSDGHWQFRKGAKPLNLIKDLEALDVYRGKLIEKLEFNLEVDLHNFAFQVKGKEIGIKEYRLAKKFKNDILTLIKEENRK